MQTSKRLQRVAATSILHKLYHEYIETVYSSNENTVATDDESLVTGGDHNDQSPIAGELASARND